MYDDILGAWDIETHLEQTLGLFYRYEGGLRMGRRKSGGDRERLQKVQS